MVVTALIIPALIRILRALKIGQQVRVDGPERHITEKQGTPTMGGLAIIFVTILVLVTLGSLAYPRAGASSFTIDNYVYGLKAAAVVIIAMVSAGFLGFLDDFSKVNNKRSLGLTGWQKIAGQVSIGIGMGLLGANWLTLPADVAVPFTTLTIPMGTFATTFQIGSFSLYVPWIYLAFIVLMVTSMTNAVNLTDGLDGLAAGTVMIVALVFAALGYVQNILPLAIVGAALSGACVGFLWWNSYPADIFMGDTGSLALGGAISGLAMVTKTELLVAIIGGIFVVEALSVVLQVLVFKRTRKRLFKMAPIHHHFEQIGWSEAKVTIRFWIVTGIFAGLGFAIYFLEFAQLRGL